MKRFLILICLLLAGNLLTAEDNSLYKKKTSKSILELFTFESWEGFRLVNYEKDINNETLHMNTILCKDEKKIKEFLVYLLDHNVNDLYHPTILVYEMAFSELTQIEKEIEIHDNKIVDVRTFLLE